MPTRQIPDVDVQYELISYDADGNERRERDGSLLSERVRSRVADATAPITDVFFTSHGWKGDVPGAIDQYDRWVGAVGLLQADRDAARARRPGFNPLIVGLHWPSLPFGDETIATPTPGHGGVLSGGEAVESVDAQVEAYASRIADTPAARTAIRTIIETAGGGAGSTTLTPALREAYATLFAESGLGGEDVAGAPGGDQDGFDPDVVVHDAMETPSGSPSASAPGVLGGGGLESVKDALLSPLQQLSFWRMKKRARLFGESGAHELLATLQGVAPPHTHFHLMGHSFGCIVVSAAVAGSPSDGRPRRPVSSLFLVQGALSLWSYAPSIPYQPDAPGYFNRILTHQLVRGPIVTTRSSFDTAVGVYYPRGAQLKRQFLLETIPYPKYGGVGSFGARGLDSGIVTDTPVQSSTFAYALEAGRIYNIEASRVIKTGGPPSGAHSDIAHPEIAHLCWQAALASP